MNYIRHLNAFFEKVSEDDRLNPSHVSLYMALFQFWNLSKFENPFSICRKEVLQVSKIGSLNTYHKCLYDLHEYGYLQYIPSFNHFRGSRVIMYNFDTGAIQEQDGMRRKNDTGAVQELRRSINNINIINNKKRERKNTHSQNLKFDDFEKEKKAEDFSSELNLEIDEKRKRVPREKEKKFIPPDVGEVISFFKSEKFPELEAKKFFNHFQANGWKIGGKTPMKDWNAAARKWILNSSNFSFSKKSNQHNHNINPNDKDYSKPL